MNEMIENIKIHIVSLEQDMEAARNHEPLAEDEYDESDDYLYGSIETAKHLLSVAEDILNK
jgi:hypothetical protein